MNQDESLLFKIVSNTVNRVSKETHQEQDIIRKASQELDINPKELESYLIHKSVDAIQELNLLNEKRSMKNV